MNAWLCISTNNLLKVGQTGRDQVRLLREQGRRAHSNFILRPQIFEAFHFSGCCEICGKVRREGQEESKKGREEKREEV